MITLYRGDDTTFRGVKRLRVTIESKESLAGCSATFEVCGVVKHVPDVSTGSFWLSLTGEDTARMPLGAHAATLRVWDAESRRRTVSNTIMVCVTERIGDAYPGEEEVAVSLGAMVEWRNVSGKPSINGVVLEGDKTTKELGIRGVAEAALVDLPEDYTPDALRAAVNAINACLRASMACLVAAACALLAPCAARADGDADTGVAGRVTVRELGDMTSVPKQFKALSNLTHVVTSVSLDGLVSRAEVDAATNALTRAVAEVRAEGTNHVTRAEVEPEYDYTGRPTGAALKAVYADEAFHAATIQYPLPNSETDFIGYVAFSPYDDFRGFSVISQQSEDSAELFSDLIPDGSPFMTSNATAQALRGYAKKSAIPFPFDLCLSPDGDDAADGLSPKTAKRTLAGAVAAANATGLTNLVVAAFEGDYEPPYADFGAVNAIVFRAVGDRARTRVVGGTNAVCALASASCEWRGFTFTGFAGKGAGDLTPAYEPICRFGGMAFRDCDFADNDFVVDYGYAAYNTCQFFNCTFDRSTYRIIQGSPNNVSHGILYRSCAFDDCSVNGVTLKGAVHGNGDYDDALENTTYHILMWDIDAGDTIFRLPGSMHANNRRYRYRNVTLIAPSAWCVPPKSTSYKTPFPTDAAYVTNCLYVIGDAKPGSTSGYILAGKNTAEVPRCAKGVYVALDGSANLTADGVAADMESPAVRDDGEPDYGWKSSGLGAAKTARAQAKKYADTKTASVSSSLASHRNSRANPHKVTAAQVGAYTKAETDALLTPTVALTAEQKKAGVTYVKNGLNQDCAIAIGTNAVASVDPAYVASAPSNAILRSVSVAIGGNADARGDGTGTSQGVAIGWWAQAKAGNAIAIGSGAQHTNETAMSGNATVANAACAVALGYSAKATAPSAVQIGFGTNATPHSLQFEGVPIVRGGRLVAPGIETADVRRVVGEMLAPRTYEDVSGDVIEVRSHTLTVVAPTNGPCDEIELAPTLTRNYEVFLSNVAALRESLPMSFDTESGDVAKLGAWWGRKLVRLPAKVSVKSPSEDIAILEVEPYDDGWDWTPQVTNATFAATGGVMRLEKVLGVNLHAVTNVTVSVKGKTATVNYPVGVAPNPLYGKVGPKTDLDVPVDEGDTITVTVSGETGTCAFAADPFAAKEGAQ